MEYFVRYTVAGQPCPITAGPYPTYEDALWNAKDIAGYMGVSDTEVYSINSEPEK